MANLLSSRVFDRLSVEKSRLNVAVQSIRSGALNEIKIQNRDLSGRISRFQIDRILQVIDQERNQLNSKMSAIHAADPVTNLKRGFSLVYKTDDQLVKSIDAVSEGESLKTRVQDGLIISTVNETEGNQNDGKRDDLRGEGPEAG
jgi:exonuclease VII large subunit